MYNADSLHHLAGQDMFKLLKETHEALVGLLYEIEGREVFNPKEGDLLCDAIAVLRAEHVHRILLTHNPKVILERKYLDGGTAPEFREWVERSGIQNSFAGSREFFSR